MKPSVLIDLTLPLREGMRGYSREPHHDLNRDGWNSSDLILYSHAGTHMDAPSHFGASATTIDTLPLGRFFCRAWCVDCSGVGPRTLLTSKYLGAVAIRFEPGDALLLRTDWSRFVDDPSYRNSLPRISDELALWALENEVSLIGVEPPSVADVHQLDEVTRVHRTLFAAGIVIVEGLTHLDQLPTDRPFFFGALPLKIRKGDGCPCRAFAALNPIALEAGFIGTSSAVREPEGSLPAEALEPCLTGTTLEVEPGMEIERRAQQLVIVVRDDDPTGTQTVKDIPVLLKWDEEVLAREMKTGPGMFFLMTNSRALPAEEARSLGEQLGLQLRLAALESDKKLLVISRGDSTLRGHFPDEVDGLAIGLGWDSYSVILCPFFAEGGRLTIGNVHWVREGDDFIPAGQTPFARDASFGYTASDLRNWVFEKSRGGISREEMGSFSIDRMRKASPAELYHQVTESGTRIWIANALEETDLKNLAQAALLFAATEQPIIFRTAASFVRVVAGQARAELISASDFPRVSDHGALIVVGSHVPKTTRQLAHLRATGRVEVIEIEVAKLLKRETREAAINETKDAIDKHLLAGRDVALCTSRELVAGENEAASLIISQKVSQGLVDVVARLSAAPQFMIAKGGITSSDLATDALHAQQAQILGQVHPGVPCWQLGPESRFPGMAFVVFPGNVGEDAALTNVVERLLE